MVFLRWWVIAAALLMLSGVDMEHLHAENLNLLHPHEHNLVLNRGIRGTYGYMLSLSSHSLSNKSFVCAESSRALNGELSLSYQTFFSCYGQIPALNAIHFILCLL